MLTLAALGLGLIHKRSTGQPKPGDLGNHVLLDPVVQVPLEALAFVILCGDEPLPRRTQLLKLLSELGAQAHVRH